MATLAEKLWDEGYQEGYKIGIELVGQNMLLETIEFGLFLKFGHRGVKLMARIRNIQDVEKLRCIKDSLIKIDNLSDIEKHCID